MTHEESFGPLAAVWREMSTGAAIQSLLAAVEYATPVFSIKAPDEPPAIPPANQP